MENIRSRTLMNSGMFCAVFTLLTIVIASGSLGLAQGSRDRAIDQAQRAVREQITSLEGGRNLMAHFNSDARTEFKSNAEVRVRGTGVFSRNNDGKSRNFSYEAVVNNRNSNVSDTRYDWRGDWYSSRSSYVMNRLTGAYRINQSRSDNPATVANRVTRGLPGGEQQRRRNVILRRLEARERSSMRPAPLRAQGDANGKHNLNRDDSDQGRRAFTGILADRKRAGVSLP